ncbi:hypothetical protein ACH5Y9_05465 [Methylomonas sp. BW4-1]|uniref:hypothetical protein n=1 Tax=Methylomonas sp. BW4-1 TaxID=3376685 RepID=UPI004041CEB2
MSETPPCDSGDTLSSFKKHLESLKETKDKHVKIQGFKDVKEKSVDQVTGVRDCVATVITSSGDNQIDYQVNPNPIQPEHTTRDFSVAWGYLGVALVFYGSWVWVMRRAGQSKIIQWAGGFLATIMLAASIPTMIDRQEQLQPPTSIESAKSKMLGTWTYTQPLYTTGAFPFEWVKWEIRDDGTMTAWHAAPTDNDWGKGETKRYEVITDKFSNTGERWYGIEDTNYHTVGIYQNGHIVLYFRSQMNGSVGIMERGEKIPFSR